MVVILIFREKVIHSHKPAYKRTEDPISGILRLLLDCYFTAPFSTFTGVNFQYSHTDVKLCFSGTEHIRTLKFNILAHKHMEMKLHVFFISLMF